MRYPDVPMCGKTANMASRHVDVNERRLRPVYDALDSMKNKQAIQLADKILKKQKDFHCAKALKALALLRSGKPDECSSLVDELCADKPADESTLQAMTICFREMQKPEGIASIYEAAVKQNPNNEELLSHLFMAYVRIMEYKKQQQAAMNLYKACPKNPYYFWAVMSIVMQALNSPDKKLAQSMFLPLAERMVEKFVKEGKIEAEAEVLLYINILENQEKYEKALEVVNGPLREKLVSQVDGIDEKRARYLLKLTRWTEANVLLKQLIEKNPDQWSYYEMYFTSSFALIADNCAPSDDETCKPDHTVEMIDTYLESLVNTESSKEKKALRGPYLSQLELEKQLKERGLQSSPRQSVKPLPELLEKYFERFGDKNCCFTDMSPYIYLLSEEERERFIDTIKENLVEVTDNSSKSEKIKHMLRQLCIAQFSRYIGRHQRLTPEEKIKLSKDYMKMHKDGLQYGQERESTELQFSDGFALLAGHLLLDVNQEKGSKEMIWHILILLESAVKASPSNHHFKVLLMRIYADMGAAGPCRALYESLEVKHIGLDTLGYLMTRYVYFLGHFEASHSLYSATLKHFFGNQKDTPEYVIAAYKYGSFEKIPEFIDFRNRVNSSLQFTNVTFEKTLLEVLQISLSLADCQTSYSEMDLLGKCPLSKDWLSSLRDNRDVQIMASWDPPDRLLTEEQHRDTFDLEVLWIRLRCLTIRGLGLAVSLVPRLPTLNDTKPDSTAVAVNGETGNSEQLENTVSALEKLLVEIDQHHAKSIKLPFLGPPPSCLIQMLHGNYSKVVLMALKICQWSQVLHDAAEIKEGITKSISEKATIMADMLKANTALCISRLTTVEGEKKMFNGSILEPIVHLVECISHLAVTGAVCCNRLHKVTATKKAKKKKATPHHVVELRESFKGFLDTLKTCTTDLHSSLVDVQVTLLSDDVLQLSITDMDPEVQSSIASDIWEKMQTSYKQSVKEITDLLQTKVAFAKSLHL